MKRSKTPQVTITRLPLSDMHPDVLNANKGTQRGRAMLESSVRRYGTGRSILADKHRRVIAGNKTLEAAEHAGVEEVLLVPFTGKQLVVAQRTDLDLETDTEAKELAIVDNQANAVGLSWDPTNLKAMEAAGVDMRQFFRQPEWDKIIKGSDAIVAGEEIPEMALQPFEEYNYLVVVFKSSQDWQGACDMFGIRKERVQLGNVRKVGLGRVLDGSTVLKRLKGTASNGKNSRRHPVKKKVRTAAQGSAAPVPERDCVRREERGSGVPESHEESPGAR